MTRPSWDEYFLDLAAMAATRSKDESTKVGAVIVDDNRNVRATGYNGFPRGVRDDLPERNERPAKYRYTEHAERNAIYSAARSGTSVAGCTVYCTHFPCTDCARGIIQAGIKRVVVPADGAIPTFADDWEMAYRMLDEAGVKLVELYLFRKAESS